MGGKGRMKGRLIAGLLLGATVFAAVFGMAASLGGIDADKLGADDQVIAACDTTGGIASSYTVAYTTTGTAGYKVGDVTISKIDDSCNGGKMSITLTGASSAKLAEKTVPVAVNSTAVTPDTSDTVSFSDTNTLAESVTGIHVVISGGATTN